MQFDAMMPRIKMAYESGRARGLTGPELTMHIAREAERPIESAIPKYAESYRRIVSA